MSTTTQSTASEEPVAPSDFWCCHGPPSRTRAPRLRPELTCYPFQLFSHPRRRHPPGALASGPSPLSCLCSAPRPPGQGGKFSGDLLHITVTVVFVVQKNEDMLVAVAGFQSGKWWQLPQHRSVSYLFTHLEFILYLVLLGGLGFFFLLLLIGFLSDF